ncbi:hypothetical protein [Lichenicoccus sp.]|uniref:hypothetical protein n=1 Tax=Lichenicoccus sp. TaxID=2781899 RepID=UPI003D0B95B1
MRRLVLVGVLLTGCASQSRPVTIAVALDELQNQLQAAGAVSVVGAGPIRFAEAARAAQCKAQAANPELPILTHDITINLTGTFTASGGFALGPSITGGPPFGISSSLVRGQTQQLTLPLTFAALSELPDVAAAQRIALFTGLPANARAAGTRRTLAERDALRRQTRRLIIAFDLRRCPAGPRAPAGAWQPLLRGARVHPT